MTPSSRCARLARRRVARRSRAASASRRAWASGGRVARGVRGPDARARAVLPAPSALETIVDLVDAADWDEREAHDLLRPALRRPRRRSRPLVAHPEPRAGRRRSRGDGVHQVAVGPIHAGVIESGHFRFHVVGDRILALDLRLFYKHRGLERAAEGRTPEAGAGLRPARLRGLRGRQHRRLRAGRRGRARAAGRTATCAPRARCCSSSSGSTTTCTTSARSAPASASRPGRWPSRRSRSARSALNADARRPPLPVRRRSPSGAGRWRLDAAAAERTARGAARAARRRRRRLARARVRRRRCRRGSTASACSPARTPSALGTVGPAARAAGRARRRARATARGCAYERLRAPRARRRRPATSPPGCRCAPPSSSTTCELLDDLLARAAPGRARPSRARRAVGTRASGRVECPRGATHVRRRARRRPRRARCACAPAPTRTGRRVAHAAAGCLLPDFPLINKSFELCYACVDR